MKLSALFLLIISLPYHMFYFPKRSTTVCGCKMSSNRDLYRRIRRVASLGRVVHQSIHIVLCTHVTLHVPALNELPTSDRWYRPPGTCSYQTRPCCSIPALCPPTLRFHSAVLALSLTNIYIPWRLCICSGNAPNAMCQIKVTVWVCLS